MGEGPVRYPLVLAYGAGLPEGWASYPECRARAELVLSLRAPGALAGLTDLPEALQHLVDGPTPDGDWLSEVRHVGVLLAIRDSLFASNGAGDDDFLRWIDRLNRDLMSSADHADLFAQLAAPPAFVATMPLVWSRLREGTTLTSAMTGDARAEIVHTHPPALYPDIMHESHRRAIVAGLARAGAVLPEVTFRTERASGEARTVFEASWRGA